MRFIQKFPTVQDLAQASEPEVLKQWEGLGYYRRARHLLEAAQVIVNNLGGVFPRTYKEVLALKGVGDYTAAAITSFAYNDPNVAIDSNVERVVSRYFGIPEVKSSLRLKKAVKAVLEPEMALYDSPAEFNQMFIDFGALMCKAKVPLCGSCPISDTCYAFTQDQVFDFPKALVKKQRVKRYFHYLVLIHGDEVALNIRDGADIWSGMHEFPLIETSSHTKLDKTEIIDYLCGAKVQIERVDKEYKQLLTHREVYGCFYIITGDQLKQTSISADWKSVNSMGDYAFPGVIRLFLAENMHNFI